MILNKCRVCNSLSLAKVFSLGLQPLANNLSNYEDEITEKYPLELNVCKLCFNCQLTHVINPKKLFLKYLYQSSISSTFQKHFDTACQKYILMFGLKKKKSVILDIGSNDGIGLIPFKKRGFANLIAVEPSKNLAKITSKLKIKTYNSFLDEKIAMNNYKKCNLITASNVFAHVNDIQNMTKNIFNCLHPDGILVLEVQYLINMLKEKSFDNIYHEHVNYWTVNCLSIFFSNFSASIFRVEKIFTHGGSIRVFIKKNINSSLKIHKSVGRFLNEEKKFKINSFNIYKKFYNSILNKKIKVNNLFRKLYLKKKIIIGFGAPAKATTFINFFNLKKYIEYIVDDNKLKNKKYVPNTKIIILNKPKHRFVDYVIVFAWNYFSEIKKKNKKLSYNFVNIFNI
jgi:2-polyprenyl-3-methyl-5-hydroxy-6-metoxy-1,4-benzoquinol methylase